MRRVAQTIIGSLGGGDLFAQIAKLDGATILMYHSIASHVEMDWVSPQVRWPAQAFERQVDFLRRRRRVVSMTELGTMLSAGKTPRRGTVVITFDDGYRDTLHLAAPILAAANMVATVYLPTWYIDHAKPQWVDELWGIFKTRRSHRLDTMLGAWDVKGDRPADAAMRLLSSVMLECCLPDRECLLAQVRESLRPAEAPPRLTMTWAEVRQLVQRFPSIDVGGHTVGHIDLKRCTQAEARSEIIGCADTIEREIGLRPRHFSFPYGRWCESMRDLVRSAGFETAVGAGNKPLIRAGDNRWSLPRIEGHASMARLSFLTSGAYPRMPLVSRG